MGPIDLLAAALATLVWSCYKHLHFERQLKYRMLVLCRCTLLLMPITSVYLIQSPFCKGWASHVVIEYTSPDAYLNVFFFPFPFQNEDLNDLRKSSFNSWVPRLKLFHNSQAGPHVFLFSSWYDASITVCLLCTILRSSLTELHALYCAKQKESTVTPGQWVCVNFILNLKDLAGHNELVCPPPCRKRMGLFASPLQRMFHLLWSRVPWNTTVNYFIWNCSRWVERVLNI